MNHRIALSCLVGAALASLVFHNHAGAQPADPPKGDQPAPPPTPPAPPPDQPPAPPPEQPAEPPKDPPPEPPPEPPPVTTGVISGTIEVVEPGVPDSGVPVAGATITVVTAGVRTTSDAEGRYKIEVPAGAHTLRVDVVGFQPLDRAVTVTAGATLELPLQLAPDQIGNEVVVVVGSRTPRSNLETTVPVDIVTSQDIARSGRTETGRMLHTLVPSYVSTPQAISDGSDHIDPASLRGLGPDQVLVLVNGKRRHKTALIHVNGTFGRGTVGTDLNAIPSGSIKRIEVLRDGAASQYGSDAIAGVINIVTKDVTDLVEITALSGMTASGDGAQIKTSANYGWKLGEKGFLNITGEFLRRDPTNRAGTYTGPIYSSDPAMDAQILAENGLTRDDFKMKIGESSAIVGMGGFNMELPVGDKAKFYAFGDTAYRRGLAAGFNRFPVQVAQNVPEFYSNGFLPHIATDIRDAALAVGVRRKGTWDVDVSLTHGRNSMTFNVEDSVNASLGTASPTTFDAGEIRFEQTVANLDLLHRLDTKMFKSLSLVLGSEFRVENYQIVAGDEASYILGPETVGMPPAPKAAGAQVFPGFQPANEVDRTRDSVGVYAGVESEIRKGLTLDAGARFEQYSDFGNSLIGKVAARVALAKQLSLRGAVSTGFRAPSLQQLWFSNISTQFIPDAMGVLQPNQVLTSNNASPVTRNAFGIPELDEERSFHASAGLTARPIENLSITADAYFVRLVDRIVLTSNFSIANPVVADILSPFPGVSQAQFFSNAIDTDTKGVDVVLDYAMDLRESGKLNLTALANFTSTRVKDVKVPSSLQARFSENLPQLRQFYFGRQAENRIEDSVPRQKGSAGLRYTLKKLTAQARASYYGKVFFKPDNSVNDEEFGAKVLVDAEVSYQLTKNLLLGLGGTNLFNTFPDKLEKEPNTSFGRFVYTRNVSQIDQNGAFYYLKAELTFF